MASKDFEIRTCDRCGEEAEAHGDPVTRNPPGGWAKLLTTKVLPHTNAEQLMIGRTSIRGGREGIDLCPDCAASLKDWWEKLTT
jgi:hypothetical protein